MLSDEAVTSLGTTLSFLKTSLFGAITQLVQPPRNPRHQHQTINGSSNDAQTAPPTGLTGRETSFELVFDEYEDDREAGVVGEEDDPYIPLKPARRKEERLKLTDFVPDVGYFIAGGLSGITSRTVTAPLDRLKVYLIAQTGNTSEAVQAAKSGAALQATKAGMSTLKKACQELWAAGGIRSLFAGEFANSIST